MGWLVEILKIGAGGALGVFAGALLIKRRTLHEELLACYTEYFSAVLDVAVKEDATAAQSALFLATRASHRLELVEPDGTCIMTTGLLLARCHKLVSTLVQGTSPSSYEVTACREGISEDYANALETVRKRLGLGGRFAAAEERRGPFGAPRLVAPTERSS